MNRKAFYLLTLSALTLAACAPQQAQLASAPPQHPDWAFEKSDVPVDPGFRFGKLANGLRYVIRQNATPKGTALVRMQIDTGSLDETEAERGFAHYVEHMAFNGSAHIPEGEMVKLLERSGLAFGADTNAQTGFERTTYMLDLPRNDAGLLDTAMMLMRETASELNFEAGAVNRERGVVLAEMRDRNSFQLRNFVDSVAFAYPAALYGKRLPIGTAETLNAASADALKAFWRREYVPAQAVVIVIGDFAPEQVETLIKARFADWKAAPAEAQPNAGPVDPALKAQTDIYLDPAISELVSATRHGPWPEEPDTIAQRREDQLRRIGYSIINRRLQRLALRPDPPYRGAFISSGAIFKAGVSTSLNVNTVDGGWKRGLTEAALEYRRALEFGFTSDEVAEQVAQVRTASQNAAASADTRNNAALVGGIMALIEDDVVPDTPQNSLTRLEAFIPAITPETVLAALKREILPLDEPLLRLQGRAAPEGGQAALRAAWDEAAKTPLMQAQVKAAGVFGYGDFGPPGTVVSDSVEPALGIRKIRFANGVRLNLKHTDLDKDKITVSLNLDGGNMLQTKANPRAAALAAILPLGGLGKHSLDELQTLMAGRTVSTPFSPAAETFTGTGTTTRRDLELQLQVMTALLTDPGYRSEGEVLFYQGIANYFAALRATPNGALSADIEGILSDNDPRFMLGRLEDYRALSFARLKTDISDRLSHGAIELAMVGDLDEAQAIALVAKTFGALPTREAEFRPYPEQRQHPFTANRTPRVLHHGGPKDQALVHLTWPTRDDSDPVEALQLALLERIVQIELTDTLREKLGKAYSPGAGSDTSRIWRGYGTFTVNASVDVHEVAATRAAIAETIAELRNAPISADILQRARAPALENYDNALKSNRGWMTLAEQAQSKPDRITRFQAAKARLAAITPADIQSMAKRYLTATGAVEVTVLPEGTDSTATKP
jgi:zinc protease